MSDATALLRRLIVCLFFVSGAAPGCGSSGSQEGLVRSERSALEPNRFEFRFYDQVDERPIVDTASGRETLPTLLVLQDGEPVGVAPGAATLRPRSVKVSEIALVHPYCAVTLYTLDYVDGKLTTSSEDVSVFSNQRVRLDPERYKSLHSAEFKDSRIPDEFLNGGADALAVGRRLIAGNAADLPRIPADRACVQAFADENEDEDVKLGLSDWFGLARVVLRLEKGPRDAALYLGEGVKANRVDPVEGRDYDLFRMNLWPAEFRNANGEVLCRFRDKDNWEVVEKTENKYARKMYKMTCARGETDEK